MILRQFLHADPVAFSYLFGCGGKAAGSERGAGTGSGWSPVTDGLW